jgi:hypothetical protein
MPSVNSLDISSFGFHLSEIAARSGTQPIMAALSC